LSADLLALQGLGTHLPYDPAPATPNGRKLQRIHDRLARLLPLTVEIEERVHAFEAGGHLANEEVNALVRGVAAWVAAVDIDERDRAALPLIERARAFQTQIVEKK